LVYTVVAMTALLGFCSLAVDFGRVELDKTCLLAASDAASRAACMNLAGGVTTAQNAAIQTAAQNSAEGNPVSITSSDIEFGTWDPTNNTFTVLSGANQANANAIRVTTGLTAARGNSIPLTFAALLGKGQYDLTVKSCACLTGNTGNCSLIGLNGITMSGGAYTDSYNSSKGAYAAGSANKNGSIASNGNIAMSNTSRVNGDVRPGIGKTATISSPASATGLVAPLGAKMSYPSVTLPSSYTDLGDVNMSSGSVSVPGGTYLIHNLTLSGTANVDWQGPVTLYIQNSYTISGGATISSYNNLPANRILNFLPTCTTASWGGSHVCVGELYAPDTDFTINGTAQLMGRVTAKSINISSSGGMHYDEALNPPGGTTKAGVVQMVQ
jgi:hypothetical protein